MTTKAASRRGALSIGRLGHHRQVVIPKDICEDLGLQQGDLVEVRQAKGAVLIKPKKLLDPDDTLSPKEAALVRKGEQQLARGESITLDELERKLDRNAGKRRRKTA